MFELKEFLKNKDHTGIQFIKYAFCGGIAAGSDIIAFFLLAWLVFPALVPDETIVKLFHLEIVEVPKHIREINFALSNGLAFLLSNTVAYLLNIIFVFRSGRHSRLKEMGLFYLVSAISVGLGTTIGYLLIHFFGFTSSVSYIAKAISTTLINFLVRKLFIFKG